ncbi:hypothetical protein C2G38_2122653 [Gigaspora rosea]|uniref:Uncharacterized protein n=1 Tax=Gigaspora rosea TaxID=44941 RepID=A0A397U1U0_9GLOM|nr:hypothetical protein C2G38_2122653 [Gigaspora rosea]
MIFFSFIDYLYLYSFIFISVIYVNFLILKFYFNINTVVYNCVIRFIMFKLPSS